MTRKSFYIVCVYFSSGVYKPAKPIPQQNSTAVEYTDIPNENGFLDNHSLVTIHMKPDEQGRYGLQ